MFDFARKIILFVFILFFLNVQPLLCQIKFVDKEWTGRLRDGTSISEFDLYNIIKDHQLWLNSNSKEGKKADLKQAILIGANLKYTNLKRADLSFSDLSSAKMEGIDIREANLLSTNLKSADLKGANLGNCNLTNADLDYARLDNANISNAILKGTKLSNTSANFANFNQVFFEPESTEELLIYGATNLSRISFENPRSAIKLLKNTNQKFFKYQQRSLEAAIRKYRAGFIPFRERYINLIFLDIPTDFGGSPYRPLLILMAMFILFSFPYMIAIKTHGHDGIFMVWSPDRVRKELGHSQHTRLKRTGISVINYGFYFSLLSMFNQTWIKRDSIKILSSMQPREFNLVGTGWVRVLSGLQSLLTIYLGYLWYVGYPDFIYYT